MFKSKSMYSNFLTMGLVTAAITISINAHAIQEFETVVTDKKFNSSSTIVIDKKEIEKSRSKNLTTLLASQANISISNANFQPNSIFLRGGDSSHVLILIDGVPAYDPSTLQRTLNLNSINLKSVQRIEVIKGSQSVLFGGQAQSGVIKIETIPQNMETKGVVLGQVGTQQSRLLSVGGVKQINEQVAIVVGSNLSDRNSLSPILDSKKTYPTRLATGEMGLVHRNDSTETFIKTTTSFDKSFSATTGITGRAEDTDNFETSTYNLGALARVKLHDAHLQPTLSVFARRASRIFEQEFVVAPTKWDYQGEVIGVRYEMLVAKNEKLNILSGLSYSEEKVLFTDMNVKKSDVDADFAGIFLKGDYNITDSLQVEGGVRTDLKNSRNQFTTYQIGFSVDKKLKLEYGTGFRYPSLSQLYDPGYGNPNLKPESSTSASITYDHQFNEDLFGSLTLFEASFSNLLMSRGNPMTSRLENVSKSRTKGLEAVLGYRFDEQASTVNLVLGYQEPRDLELNQWLAKRPLRTATLKVRKELEKVGLGAEIVHNGDRREGRGYLDSYTYVNATAEYNYKEDQSYFIRGQNVTNKRYQSSFGYFDEGINVDVGAEFLF